MGELKSGPLLKKGDLINLKIDSLAFGGEGVGRVQANGSSFAVFVEDVVPGDEVEVKIGMRKRKFARGYVQKFIKKAPQRIEPKCKHFGSCGGCALQFLNYEDQLKIKEQQVRDAMKRLGGFDESVVLPIIGCESQWNYRNKMEFSFSREFSAAEKKQGKICLGLHVRRRHHDVIELTECHLLNEKTGEIVITVRDFFRKMDEQGRMHDLNSGSEFPGRPLSFTLRESKHSGEMMANLTYENDEPDFLEEFVRILKDSAAGAEIVSVYFTRINNKKGQPKSVVEKLLHGKKVIMEELQLENGKSLKFEISPQAFFQPNTKQAEVLYGLAIKAAGLSGGETVYDLFCGTGTIGSFCAHAAKKVYGIEINESAVLNARANAALNGINNIEFICGDVGKVICEIKEKPDVVIVDPPRNGMDENAVSLTEQAGAKKIVYISCNPTTQARDLKILTKTGYKLVSVQPVDMFPQTYHIEAVATLEKF